MRSVCLYFQVHQPFRLRTYRFFNIGDDHQYYDEYQNRHIIRRVAEKCYLPANKMMLDLIKEFGGAFRISFSISGTALEQLQMYAPEVIQGFRLLAKTGCVEFLAETYAHSLASQGNSEEFIRQVELHRHTIEKYFEVTPTTFRNSELIYSDSVAEMVSGMGFTTMITEGAKHILGWKSPNYMYASAAVPRLKIFLRNFRLSDDIAFRFSERSWSEWPVTTEKFTGWLNGIEPREEVVNLFIDYETIGERQWKETGIFEFFKSLPKAVLSGSAFNFATPSELANQLQPVAGLQVPYPISWADEEKDLTSWLGNELQDEAFSKLYSIAEKVRKSNDKNIQSDWQWLQTTDHFYYMCTKWFSDGAVHKYFNPYPSPYEAFINYMNVLSDFIIRVDKGNYKIEEGTEETKPGKKAPRVVTGKLKEEELVKPIRTLTDARVRAAKQQAEMQRKLPAEREEIKQEDFHTLDFSDIINLSDKKVKDIIKHLDIATVSAAMSGADEKIREKVEKNLGKRALKTYHTLMTQIRTISASEIKKSRRLIEKQIKSHSK